MRANALLLLVLGLGFPAINALANSALQHDVRAVIEFPGGTSALTLDALSVIDGVKCFQAAASIEVVILATRTGGTTPAAHQLARERLMVVSAALEKKGLDRARFREEILNDAATEKLPESDVLWVEAVGKWNQPVDAGRNACRRAYPGVTYF